MIFDNKRNDFDKTEEYIRQQIKDSRGELIKLDSEIENIYSQLEQLQLNKLKSNFKPPKGY